MSNVREIFGAHDSDSGHRESDAEDHESDATDRWFASLRRRTAAKCELIAPCAGAHSMQKFPMRLEVAAVAAFAAVAATAAYIRRLRAELAAAKRDNDEFVAAAVRGTLSRSSRRRRRSRRRRSR